MKFTTASIFIALALQILPSLNVALAIPVPKASQVPDPKTEELLARMRGFKAEDVARRAKPTGIAQRINEEQPMHVPNTLTGEFPDINGDHPLAEMIAKRSQPAKHGILHLRRDINDVNQADQLAKRGLDGQARSGILHLRRDLNANERQPEEFPIHSNPIDVNGDNVMNPRQAAHPNN